MSAFSAELGDIRGLCLLLSAALKRSIRRDQPFEFHPVEIEQCARLADFRGQQRRAIAATASRPRQRLSVPIRPLPVWKR